MAKRISAVLLAVVLAASCAPDTSEVTPTSERTSPATTSPATTSPAVVHESYLVNVKYRSTPVDLAADHFDYLSTTASSFVHGAWYDDANGYLVLRLNATYYHYCDVPTELWLAFAGADSFGAFYNQRIEGYYDCRVGYVPAYPTE